MPKIRIKRMGIDPQTSKQVPMKMDIESACSCRPLTWLDLGISSSASLG